jgi:hypothetical protein
MNVPDPLHWTQNSCFGACRTVSLLHESRCKTRRTSAINDQVRYMKLRWLFSQRTHVIHSIGPKTQVNRKCLISKSSGPFRYSTKVDAELAELVPLTHKFAKGSCVGFFRNERTRSTPLDPKLMVWGISDRFVTARKSMQNWSNWCH